MKLYYLFHSRSYLPETIAGAGPNTKTEPQHPIKDGKHWMPQDLDKTKHPNLVPIFDEANEIRKKLGAEVEVRMLRRLGKFDKDKIRERR